jgi:multidrug resistance efflux pump
MSRKWAVVAVLVVILAGALAAAFLLTKRYAAQPQVIQQQPAPAPEPVLSFSGRIQATELIKVPVTISGQVTAFHVEAGDEVYEGQLLAEIRNEGLESNRQAAEAELERAQERVTSAEALVTAARLESSRASADALRARSEFDRASKVYERQRLLFAEGATPRLVYEKAEKDYRSLEQESQTLTTAAQHAEERVSSMQRDLDAARKLLEAKNEELETVNTKLAGGQVLSPATGIIAARRGQAGDEVNPAMDDLFQIATELSKLEVLIEPDPTQAQRIRAGQEASVIVADVPGESLPGVVKSIENGKAIVEFANPSPLVRPGLSAQVRIKVL